MEISEIREIIDNTIRNNGVGAITGNSLNAVLNAIVELIEDNINNGPVTPDEPVTPDTPVTPNDTLGGAITVVIPREGTWNDDNTNEELLQNNIECFNKLLNQTEPLLIFLRRLGAEKPFSQNVIRMRNLADLGEGTTFFALSYPMPAIVDGYEVYCLAGDKFKLNQDGTVVKITFDGTETEIKPTEQVVREALQREYHVEPQGWPIGSQNAILEFVGETNEVKLYRATGVSNENDTFTGMFDYDTFTITIPAGQTTENWGPVVNDIVLNVIRSPYGYDLIPAAEVVMGMGTIENLRYESF